MYVTGESKKKVKKKKLFFNKYNKNIELSYKSGFSKKKNNVLLSLKLKSNGHLKETVVVSNYKKTVIAIVID